MSFDSSQGFSEALSEPDLQLGPVVSAKTQSTYNDAKDSVVTEEKVSLIAVLSINNPN